MKNSPHPSEQELFEELMSYREKIFCICLGFVKNPSDAEELTQDVYVKALQKMKTLKDFRTAKVWIIKICKNTCLDYIKKTRVRTLFSIKWHPHENEVQTPESQLLQRDQIKILKQSIEQLPKKLREVLVLREYGDLSYEEISHALGIQKGTVMSRLNRARKAVLKSAIGDRL